MIPTTYNRREFLRCAITAGAGASLALGAGCKSSRAAEHEQVTLSTPHAEKLGWLLCIQLYTFRDRSFYEALPVIQGLGVRRVEPCFFLPLSKERPELKTSEALSPDQRREMKQRMSDFGIRMANYYAPIDADESKYRNIFEFAKEMGVQNIVAEPPPEKLETLDGLCQEYKINLAVHNHPEGSGSKYWNPDTLIKLAEHCGPRVGACPDTGHWVRSGLDTQEALKEYHKRILTVHLKDAAESGKRDSRDVPLGTGAGNYAALLKLFYDWKWKGVMTVEYEYLSPQLVPDVAQCLKFVEDFAAGVRK